MTQLERRFKIWIFGLLGVNIFVGFTSIVLFERMLPNITHMVNYNDVLVEDIERVLFYLARLNAEADVDLYEDFHQALDTTKSHLANPEQVQIVEQIEALTQLHPPWTKKRLKEVIDSLSKLSFTLRQELKVAHQETKFHSLTSGWIIAFITAVSILIFGWSASRVSKQTIEPVSELCRGLQEWHRGNKLRRFRTLEGSQDVKEAMAVLNEILDDRA